MATAPASGIRLKASSSDSCETDCDMPRKMWSRGRCVAYTDRPDIGRIMAAPVISEASERMNSVSPTG